MATYIALLNFTDQGIRNIKDTIKRTDAVRKMGKKFGVTLKDIYWTLGKYDVIHMYEAPDDAALAAHLASLGALGNIRSQTLRAFSQDETKEILTKVA